MFTGIVEEKGSVKAIKGSSGTTSAIGIEAPAVADGTKIGDSIMVSGACLTVVERSDEGFTVEVTPETLGRTTLGGLRPGSPVNLERALRVGERLGGHIVNGHVDVVGRVEDRRVEGNSTVFTIEMPTDMMRYVVSKGSVAVEGISLTVVEVGDNHFTVSVIPHTLEETTLSEAHPGTRVNVEVDILAKYVESLTNRRRDGGGIEEALKKGGFLTAG